MGLPALGPSRASNREAGLDAICARGPLAALTVAGTVGGWQNARDLAQDAGGRLPLRILLEDAIRHAREGYPVRSLRAALLGSGRGGCERSPRSRRFRVFSTVSPSMMPRHVQVPSGVSCALPDTLGQLAHAGLDDFYRGDVGRELATDLERAGSPVTRADLAGYRAQRVAPLAMRLRDASLWNFPPPTQGLASLILLGIFDRLGVAQPESLAHHHGLIEAVKRAFAIRDRVVTDPAFLREDPDAWLTPEAIAREAAAIDAGRAAAFPLRADHGDTVWLGAMDAEGWAVSFIQSVYWDYGSGFVLPATGVLWQNRGMSFSLDPRARNSLRPGRKPFHTLQSGASRHG